MFNDFFPKIVAFMGSCGNIEEPDTSQMTI